MKILITGGAGFIGSHLADHLKALGKDQILVVDNFATGRRDNLSLDSNLSLIEVDIANEESIQKIFEDFVPEIVIHAAASYKDPQNWQEDIRTNVFGTANILRASQKVNTKKIIYFQTSLCYGLVPRESPITLSHPLEPRGSSYAISKTAAEHYIQLSGIPYLSFRLANMFGPRNLSGPIPTFYQRLIEEKPCFVVDTRRDFVFIEDLVQLLLLAIKKPSLTGVYHVASGRDYAIKELYDAVHGALAISPPRPAEVKPRNSDDTFTILLDPSKTIADFGWKPTTPIEVGVKAAVEWYKQHGITQTYTHLKLSDLGSHLK